MYGACGNSQASFKLPSFTRQRRVPIAGVAGGVLLAVVCGVSFLGCTVTGAAAIYLASDVFCLCYASPRCGRGNADAEAEPSGTLRSKSRGSRMK